MDIQRGDSVYYRGEVWTVRTVRSTVGDVPPLTVDRSDDEGHYHIALTFPSHVQRVEQVR